MLVPSMKKFLITSLCVFFCLLRCAQAADPIFETDIKPVLSRQCGKCHSGKVRKGNLDLSSMKSIRRGGESGEALIDKLSESYLWAMIDGGEMPPDGEPQLSKPEVKLLRRWLETGAASKTPTALEETAITQHDVYPIVLLRCTTCHGPRLKRGGLDLRTKSSMLAGGKSGPALLPGDPNNSLMIQRIETEACPPREQLLKYFIRRPPATEVKTLRKWIEDGAREDEIQPDIAGTTPDPLVTDEDRQHWAFQRPKAASADSSIDAYITAKLKANGLSLSPTADRDTLIRRAYLDLTGIPPTVDEWQEWHNLAAAHWYSRMIDHLLASPRYGERWGRHWLDLAGYADSEGGVSSDPIRKVAWKYRDYVIRSFNKDKPYDQFLIEQIAGDELIDHANADTITNEMVDNLVATGFLRMGIDQTGSRTMNFVPERLGVINDAITVLGSGVMGLTLECARCHSHKYDAIPQRDYYRFKAIFQGALDEHDWLTFKKRALELDTLERRRQVAKTNPPLKAEIKKLDGKRKQAITDLRLELLRQHYPEQSDDDRSATLKALRIADNNRSQPQRILVEKLQTVEVIPDEQQPDSVVEARRSLRAIEDQILKLERRLAAPLTIRAVWDRGEPSPTYILRRGEHDKPSRLVGPGVPSVLTDGRTPFNAKPPFPDGTPKTGRRLAFARWLTSGEHPLTARVMVNRVWYHHFGTGLVKTLENFGRQGELPSHPELLDWLAIQFVNDGWSMKQLHRRIMLSQTYRQSSRVSESANERDSQARLLSHMPLRRMDAESLRDSLLYVADQLDLTPGGPPDRVDVSLNGLVSAKPTESGRWRRSIYLQYRRTAIPTMMEAFDYPEMGPNCLTRSVSTVSPQSLMLMNDGRIRNLAASLAGRVIKLAGNDERQRVETVYKMALSRLPTDAERTLSLRALNEFKQQWQGDSKAALVTYCHTILNSAAFIYVD
ncbi:MAG: hypothetical protein CMJ78_06720 [Planctomycetaceae bacterium]|nr:hypothetical protein [Planctomycetaceae bacterium]